MRSHWMIPRQQGVLTQGTLYYLPVLITDEPASAAPTPAAHKFTELLRKHEVEFFIQRKTTPVMILDGFSEAHVVISDKEAMMLSIKTGTNLWKHSWFAAQ